MGLAASLALHAWLLRTAPAPSPASDPEPIPLVEMKRLGSGPGDGGGKGKGRGLSLRDLGIGWNGSLPLGAAGRPTGGESFGGGHGGGAWLRHAPRLVLDHRLFDRIDHALDYPGEFREAGIEGTVKGMLVFSDAGDYLRRESRFHSPSRYLRVHILRVLRRVFDEPLPRGWLPGGKGFRIPCDFHFVLSEKKNPFNATPHRAGIPVGERLTFHRAGGTFGEWRLGPITGYGIAPSVGVDPGWFVEQVGKLTSRKARIDPLEKYRRDPDY